MTWSPEARRFMKVVVPSVIISSLILLAGSGCSQPSLTVEATATTLPPPGQPTLTVPATEVPTAVPTVTSTPRPTTEVQVGGGAGGVVTTNPVESLIGPDGKVKASAPLFIETDDRGPTEVWGAIPKNPDGSLKTGIVKDTNIPWFGASQGAFSGVVADKITNGQVPIIMDSPEGPIHAYVDLNGVPGNSWVPGWACLGLPDGSWSRTGKKYIAPDGKKMSSGRHFFTCRLPQLENYLKPGDQVGFVILGKGIAVPKDKNYSHDLFSFYEYLDSHYGETNTSLISGKTRIKNGEIIHHVGQILFPVKQ